MEGEGEGGQERGEVAEGGERQGGRRDREEMVQES